MPNRRRSYKSAHLDGRELLWCEVTRLAGDGLPAAIEHVEGWFDGEPINDVTLVEKLTALGIVGDLNPPAPKPVVSPWDDLAVAERAPLLRLSREPRPTAQ